MNKLFNTVFVMLVVMSVAAVMLRISQRNNNSLENVEPINTQSPEEVSSTIIYEEEEYLLIAEEGYLNLYESGEKPSLKKSERINFALFPPEDVIELKSGLTFKTVSEAYEAMESFVN